MGKECLSPEVYKREVIGSVAETQISVDCINILSQPRKTFNDIEYLAQSIEVNGLINRIIVGKFSKEECETLVESINKVWKTEHKIEDLKSEHEEGEDKFYILVAGERRFRAVNHLGNKSINVKLYSDLSVNKFHSIQASENIHEAVPPHEEAHYYSALFNESRRENPNISVSQFAKDVGRSVEKVRSALRFCDLPTSVIDLVDKGTLSYGIAIQIARLRQNIPEISESDIQYWTIKAVAKDYSVNEFTKVISQYIENKKMEDVQYNFYDLFSGESEMILRKNEIRKIVEEGTTRGLWNFIYYFKTINKFFDEGKLDKKDHPFSSSGVASLFFGVIDLEKELLPKLKHLLPGEKYLIAEDVLSETSEILNNFEIKKIQSYRVNID